MLIDIFEMAANVANYSLDHESHCRSTSYRYSDIDNHDNLIHIDLLCHAILHEHIYHLTVSIQHKQLRGRLFIR